MLFDCKNILNGNNIRPELIDAAWIPDNSDLEKYIKFEFSTWQNINEIRLYQNVNSKKKIENIEIIFSDQTTNKYRLDNELTTVIKIQKEKIKWIKIKILDSNIINSGFSEIEILNNEQTNYKFVKVLDGDNFIYDNYIFSNLHINVYEYNKGNVRYLKENEYEIYINNQRIEANNLDKGKKKFELKVSLKEYPDIYDKVVLKRKTFLEIFKHQLKLLFNKLIFGFDYFLARVINKIRKVYLNIKEKEKVENERK